MRLEKIITLANSRVRLPFLAMERSLRAVGCSLPLEVIPFDLTRFTLPNNAVWAENPALFDWLDEHHAKGTFRKYHCLLQSNYLFVDTDIVFLRNPESVFQNLSGFITFCSHWRNADHTVTPESLPVFSGRSTNWQKNVFNTGQFACDRVLYQSVDELRSLSSRFPYTCLTNPYHEQPGVVLAVHESRVPIINLTLPPYHFESSWAGDYPDDFESFWRNESRTPPLIHWAGTKPDGRRPVDELFFNYLSASEKEEFLQINACCSRTGVLARLRTLGRRLKHLLIDA